MNNKISPDVQSFQLSMGWLKKFCKKFNKKVTKKILKPPKKILNSLAKRGNLTITAGNTGNSVTYSSPY